MIKDVTVPNVDVDLLRTQRNMLLGIVINPEAQKLLEGVVNLLDSMLDIAEVGHVI